MRKLFCVLLVFAMAIPVFAEKIDFGVSGNPPIVSGPNEDFVNGQIKDAFDNVLNDLNGQFSEVEFGSPTKFLGAMSNSSVYGSHGGTTRAYGGYKKLSATFGPMFGFQLPSGLASIIDDLNNLSDVLKDEGDINLGAGPNIINVNFGLNMGIIKLDKLYLGARVGYFKLPSLIDDFSYDYLTLGATANYQIIPSVSLAGLITWRGLNLGSGIIYNKSNIKVTMPLGDPIDEKIGDGTLGSVHMEPKASLNLNINTVTVPLEAMTAIKLLIFNIPLGIGADLAFGKTSLDFGVDSDIDLIINQSGYTQTKKGDISVNTGASSTPSVFNFKIMTGLGLHMGPVVIDIPFTYYPAGPGYSLGLTMGAVF